MMAVAGSPAGTSGMFGNRGGNDGQWGFGGDPGRVAPTHAPVESSGESAPRSLAQVDSERTFRYRHGDADDRVEPGEAYDPPNDNRPNDARHAPLSTFSIDVDTASYANVRRFLNAGETPPRDAVRIEELINYFPYHYAPPHDSRPFSVHVEIASCPWSSGHRLARIGLKGKDLARGRRPAANLVFLIDVSGSMADANKLPLVKRGLGLLIDGLEDDDHVAIVTYAGSSGVALPPTSGANKERIRRALDGLSAGGSTNGASGVDLAYATADEDFVKGGVNRVILATDGDWNVGITDRSQLVDLIKRKATGGVFLSVLGFGMRNLKDATMEQLADNGNGSYAYIDSLEEAHKVLVEQMNGTLVTIAKDVKLQVEFNPAKVASYRLIGYENRMLARRDFTDDRKDAGEIGAGHTVTALYEIVPADGAAADVTPRRYAPAADQVPADGSTDEMLAVNVRYKLPDADRSTWFVVPARDTGTSLARASEDFRFAAAVAGFGLVLRQAPYRGSASLAEVYEQARGALGDDAPGYRHEFIELVRRAMRMDR
ncbi:MAG: VWA domain-containing protein [Planctomycetes bacterium]|nr:VWA domain-containing protein [Planctomycetota bacterium]